MQNRDVSSWKTYRKQSNKMRKLIRQDYQKEQNKVARLCKVNPKKFWKYVNSKSKSKDRIGALKYTDEQGNMMSADTPAAKAEALSAFFSSVCSHEPIDSFKPLAQRK